MLSEFQVVRAEFYHHTYLKETLKRLVGNKNKILSLEGVVAYNTEHSNREGGRPSTHPAWPTGQDSFDKFLEVKD